MADFSEALEIDPHILEARLRFLSARIDWHLKRGTSAMHRACAATLQRDAGAIALILGRVDDAQLRFVAAADLRFQLGFYDGLQLLQFGGPSLRSQPAFERDLAWVERSLLDADRKHEDVPPLAAAASQSPRQLVSVLQAADFLDIGGAAGLAAERLQVYAAYPLGVTQISVGAYLKLYFQLREGHLDSGRRTLIAMSSRREELIKAAQLDRFHWRLAQKPGDLIDFDILSLGLTALEHDEHVFEQAREIAAEFGPTGAIPFDAARLLRPLPPTEAPLHFRSL